MQWLQWNSFQLSVLSGQYNNQATKKPYGEAGAQLWSSSLTTSERMAAPTPHQFQD
jgi:hypothetical protein